MTHGVVINHPCRGTTLTHVSVQGPVPGSDSIIASAVLLTGKTRFFPMAQTQKPTPFVPSAWAPTCTMSMHAMLPGHGMVGTPQWPEDKEATCAFERMMLPSVWTGRDFEAATAPSTTPSTFALDAVQSLMELTGVLEHRKHKALTPYHPDAWEGAL